jgi:signal transduction histidine kinase
MAAEAPACALLVSDDAEWLDEVGARVARVWPDTALTPTVGGGDDPFGEGRGHDAVAVVDARLGWNVVAPLLERAAADEMRALVVRRNGVLWEAIVPGSASAEPTDGWLPFEASLQRRRDLLPPVIPAGVELLSRLSHELRTPLNAILGFAQLLEIEPLTSDQQESVRQILGSGRHLLAMINGVLEIARVDSGRAGMTSESIDVGAVVAEALDLVARAADAAGVLLRAASGTRPSTVRGDRSRVRQVLLVLVSNAINYNQPRGRVEVGWAERSEAVVRFSVVDDGPGIPAQLATRLFMPFDRLGAERTGVPGTGLGLSLAKRLVEAMGGAIGLDSTPGVGTTAWFELPRVDSSAPPDSSPSDSRHPSARNGNEPSGA